MIESQYQQYLWLIGKLKDVYTTLHVDADHKNIHTFYLNKLPLFKLFYGKYTNSGLDSIVISFHINVLAPEAIVWFKNVQDLHPPIRVADIWIDDDAGETYLGEDAEKIRDLMVQKEVLKMWQGQSHKKETQEFVSSKVLGRLPGKRIFDSSSQKEVDQAIIEFENVKKPIDDGEVH